MSNLNRDYLDLIHKIRSSGVKKKTRNGETISLFGETISAEFTNGTFPIISSKRVIWKSIVKELMWFLKGRSDLKFLMDRNCGIWNGDFYARFKKMSNGEYTKNNERMLTESEFLEKMRRDPEFRERWGDGGPIYGKQWRHWKVGTGVSNQGTIENLEIDQLCNVVEEIKKNPDSRRLLVSAWNPTHLSSMLLPPCHYSFQFYTRELSKKERRELVKEKLGNNKASTYQMDELGVPSRGISLIWNQRSVDVFLGLPFNISSYALLLAIVASEVNMVPLSVKGMLGDTHLYLNHISASKKIYPTPPSAARLVFHDQCKEIMENKSLSFSEKIDRLNWNLFKLENYNPSKFIKAPLNN